MFWVEIVGVAILLAWLRMRSKSVWPAILLHASHNLFDQMLFQPLTKHENSAYFAGEQGFLTVLAVALLVVAALLLWRKKEAQPQEKPAVCAQ